MVGPSRSAALPAANFVTRRGAKLDARQPASAQRRLGRRGGAHAGAALALLAAIAAGAGAPTAAHAADLSWWPDQAFAQAGIARDAQAAVFGAAWRWRWRRDLWGGEVTGYWEASFGRWRGEPDDGQRSSAWVTQVGATPVLRWHPGGDRHSWFVEAGIGGNVLLPIYRSRDKRFSTTFNFGDHVAVGWPVGADGAQEVVLRLQHFSNAGIKRPNPGEDFVQVRYVWRL